jgi:PKD repeat protein
VAPRLVELSFIRFILPLNKSCLRRRREVGIRKVRLSAILLVFLILVPIVCLPANAASPSAQTVEVKKLVDESNYKETLFVITSNGTTYHIIVQANITEVGNETYIGLSATLYNPANETITASARTPDTFPSTPFYNGVVTAWDFHLDAWVVSELKRWLPVVIVVALVAQVLIIIYNKLTADASTLALDTLETLAFGGPFIYASVPWVLLTLLNGDTNSDGSFDMYVPIWPPSPLINLLLNKEYFVATGSATAPYWWVIVEKEVYTDIPIPFDGVWRIVWFTYWEADLYSTPPHYTGPAAAFQWTPNQPIVNATVTFASTSSDPDGSITNYTWSLGDGGQKTTQSFTYNYNQVGKYNVTLTVADNHGLTNSTTQTVSVQPAPLAQLNAYPDNLEVNVTIGKNATVQFAVGEISNQTDLHNVNFNASDLTNYFNNGTISLGNITFNKNAITVPKGTYTNVSTTFNAPLGSPIGVYSGNITVTSDNGGNKTIFTDLTVYGPPIANFTWSPLTPKVGNVVTFDGSSSVPGGGSILTYAWNFGDGQMGSGNTTVHTYATAATYTVTLNVTDTNGLWSIKQEQVQVVTVDTSPPTTTLIIGDPKCNTTKKMSVIPSTPFTLNATDPDGKTDVDSIFYKVYNATLQGAFQKYSEPFNLTGCKNGNYTIAYYSVDKAGNIESTKEVNVTLCRAYDNPGDVTGDGKVNIYDITMICMAYDSKPGDPNWNPIVDFCPSDWSHDVINIFDVVTCLQYYGP